MAEKIIINTEYTVYNSIEELSDSDKKLVTCAKKAAETAYAPYSNFFVGAALLLENGEIVTGNNQENAAYPSGLCAERVAIFHASALHPDVLIKTIAIAAKSKVKTIESPVTPCGACRQVLSEYEAKQKTPFRVIMTGEAGKVYISESVSNLLPLCFSSKDI